MKLKRYLVFGFETAFRMGDQKGGWNDFLDSFDTPQEAVDCGNKFINENSAVRWTPLWYTFQVVDLNTGFVATIRGGENREIDCVRLLENMKPHEMDRVDAEHLH